VTFDLIAALEKKADEMRSDEARHARHAHYATITDGRYIIMIPLHYLR